MKKLKSQEKLSIVTFADNRAKEFFYKQGFKILNQEQRFKMVSKIEIYKRATLVRYNTDQSRDVQTPVKKSPSKSEMSSIGKLGFTSEDMETQSTKSSMRLSNSPEDTPGTKRQVN